VIWPECPSKPDEHGLALVLLTLPAGMHRSDARSHARAVLKEITDRLSPGAGLVETPTGPQIANPDFRISLSYAGDKVLIGISEGRNLGVDIVKIERIPEIEMLSRLYLPEATGTALSCADFALRWAQMEACCKASGLPLAEINEEREKAYAACDLFDCEQIGGYRMAIAVTTLRS
jgi:hypothetical protein